MSFWRSLFSPFRSRQKPIPTPRKKDKRPSYHALGSEKRLSADLKEIGYRQRDSLQRERKTLKRAPRNPAPRAYREDKI
jgi:hypothetical protein